MKGLGAAFGAYARMAVATMFQYRGEMILWALWGVVYPAVSMAMWSAAVRGAPDGQTIQGFGPRDFAAYFLLTMIVGHVGTAWDVYEMGYLVRSGRMSVKLLRPILPIWAAAADNLGYKALTLGILVPIWLGVAWVARPDFSETTWAHALLGALATLLGGALSFLWGYILALGAFWMTRTDGLGQLWFGVSLVLGGRLAPLTILPTPLQWIAAVLPFKWMIWFPSATLTGKLAVDQAWVGLACQSLWMLAGVGLFLFAWRLAVKRYSAVGA